MVDKIREEFLQRYNDWKTFCQRPEVSESSADEPYINNIYFKRLIELGKPAIPLMIEKLESNEEAHFLIFALQKIIGEPLPIYQGGESKPKSHQEAAVRWIKWWRRQQNGE